MADLENLKRFLNESNENDCTENKKLNSAVNGQTSSKKADTETEIKKNAKKESKASYICGEIAWKSLIAAIILVIICIIVEGPFLGEGIKLVNIFTLFTFDLNTILVNLMVRCFFLTMYMILIQSIVASMTCRVCSNFFTEKRKVWSKYRGTEIQTERTVKTTTDVYTYDTTTETDEVTTYIENYDVLIQCKYCGKMYVDREIESKRTRSRY